MPLKKFRKIGRKRPTRRLKLKRSTASAVKAIVKTQMNRVIEVKRADYMLEPLPISGLYHNVWSVLDLS